MEITILPFIYKKEEKFQQIPLYIEEYYLPSEKLKDEETENDIIIIDLW